MAFALKELTIVKVERTCTAQPSNTGRQRMSVGGGRGRGRSPAIRGGPRKEALMESEGLHSSTPCHSTEFPHSFQPVIYYQHVKAFLYVHLLNEFLNLRNIR